MTKEKTVPLCTRVYGRHKGILKKYARLSRGKLSESEVNRRALEEYDANHDPKKTTKLKVLLKDIAEGVQGK